DRLRQVEFIHRNIYSILKEEYESKK
ncbi:GNAT family N-acetyltransferase, partial [Bacillus cereus]